MAQGRGGLEAGSLMDFFLFGAGYSARAFARQMAADSHTIAGTTRSPENFTRLEKTGIEPFLFDGTEISSQLAARLASVTHLIISAAPDEDGDPVLSMADDPVRRTTMSALQWIGYLSTVGVYGDHRGAWVTEDSECRPVSKRSVQRLAAEKAWLQRGREIDVPVAVLRLAGIYGPGRNPFVKLENGVAKRLVKPDQVFNRVHVDDIARAIGFLAENRMSGIYNVTDDEPAPPQDVVAFAASLMGVDPPPEIPFEEADLSPMARSFYGENKRVSNERIKAAGFRFRHREYRATLTGIWSSGNWRNE